MSERQMCRFCQTKLVKQLVDLGQQPLANNLLKKSELQIAEPVHPLRVMVCEACGLFQTTADIPPEDIFTNYVYFSSYSESWVRHAEKLAQTLTQRFRLNQNSFVVEVASNDGYFLKNFVNNNIRCLGIEPAENVADLARSKGIPTVSRFLDEKIGAQIAEDYESADLVFAANVLAHVPDIGGFVRGLRSLLKPDGVLVLEFPHVANLIKACQFDTIYHEHYSYLSLITVMRVLSENGLHIFDCEEISTHGGSLRVYAQPLSAHQFEGNRIILDRLLSQEAILYKNLDQMIIEFQSRVSQTCESLVREIRTIRGNGHSVIAYGAAAKGNTLLNACRLNQTDISYVVDRNPHKQGLCLPGSHIEIVAPDRIDDLKPDYVLILPWNLKSEIMAQLNFIRGWGGKFIVPHPVLEII